MLKYIVRITIILACLGTAVWSLFYLQEALDAFTDISTQTLMTIPIAFSIFSGLTASACLATMTLFYFIRGPVRTVPLTAVILVFALILGLWVFSFSMVVTSVSTPFTASVFMSLMYMPVAAYTAFAIR